MGLIDKQNNFHLRVNIQQSLYEKWIWYFELFTFIVPEARTVVKGNIIYEYFVWHRSFWELLMPNFNSLILAVEHWLKAIEPNKKLLTWKES